MTGKHVVVTGAGTGIGRAIALRLAKEGAAVTVLAWDEEHLRETASRIDGPSHVATCDVRERRRVDRAFSRAAEALGPIHGLVTCSAIGGPSAPSSAAVPHSRLPPDRSHFYPASACNGRGHRLMTDRGRRGR